MKYMLALLILLLSSTTYADHNHQHTQEQLAARKTVVVHVNGMVCDFCARGLEKVFKKEDAVGNIIVSLEQGTITIQLKKGKELSDSLITKLVTDNGISVEGIDRGKSRVEKISRLSYPLFIIQHIFLLCSTSSPCRSWRWQCYGLSLIKCPWASLAFYQ